MMHRCKVIFCVACLGFLSSQFPALAAPVFIPAANRVGMVADPVRNVVYVPTTDGNVLRYSLASQSFLTPFALGGSLQGIDISPDGNTLVVADSSYGASSNWINAVDLTTGNSRKIQLPFSVPGEAGTYSVAFASNNSVLVTSQYNGSGWLPIQKVDLTSGAAVNLTTEPSGTKLGVSPDHSVIAFAPQNSAPASPGRYRVADGNIARATQTIPEYQWEIDAARNGRQYAVPTNDGTHILDANLNEIGFIGNHTNGVPVPYAAAYSPVTDQVYFAWFDLVGSGHHCLIDAYDSNTLTETQVIDSQAAAGPTGYDPVIGPLRISSDGALLMATVPGGVEVYPLAVPEPSTLALLGVGAISLLGCVWRRRLSRG
jgi:DNA-binding beta-propeller fold protein YncE